MRLCERITQATGIPACTAMLALNEMLELTGATRIGFVTPYLDDVQARINANYEEAGFQGRRPTGISACRTIFRSPTVTADQMRAWPREVAAASPTRSRSSAPTCAARRSPRSWRPHGIPIYDTVATTVWKSLQIAGVDTKPGEGVGDDFLGSASFRGAAQRGAAGIHNHSRFLIREDRSYGFRPSLRSAGMTSLRNPRQPDQRKADQPEHDQRQRHRARDAQARLRDRAHVDAEAERRHRDRRQHRGHRSDRPQEILRNEAERAHQRQQQKPDDEPRHQFAQRRPGAARPARRHALRSRPPAARGASTTGPSISTRTSFTTVPT